jgi:hypothetical protein
MDRNPETTASVSARRRESLKEIFFANLCFAGKCVTPAFVPLKMVKRK